MTEGLIGICEAKADCSFLVHHFLSLFVKENYNIVFLSLCQSYNHYVNVGNKIGNNISSAKDSNKLIFIDGLKLFGLALNNLNDNQEELATGRIDVRDIRQMYKMLIEKVNSFPNDTSSNNVSTVLIIDNLSVLLDVGISAEDVTGLVHYLQQFVVQQLGGCVVLGMNNDLGTDDDAGDLVWKFIQHCCTLALQVRGLDTGYCRDVHGQIVARWPINKGKITEEVTKSSQFKLSDKTCQLFAVGMSTAVL